VLQGGCSLPLSLDAVTRNGLLDELHGSQALVEFYAHGGEDLVV
jgi:hypothetical protein